MRDNLFLKINSFILIRRRSCETRTSFRVGNATMLREVGIESTCKFVSLELVSSLTLLDELFILFLSKVRLFLGFTVDFKIAGFENVVSETELRGISKMNLESIS